MNELTLTFPNSKTAIAAYGDEGQIRMEMRIMRSAVPGLNAHKRIKRGADWVDTDEYAVSDELVLALYVAKRASGLMPERGELYAIPGLGLYVAAKVRANDAVTAAARRGETLSISFRSLKPGTPEWQIYEAEYHLEPTDTVRLVEVVSNKRHRDWHDQRLATIRELQLLGYERDWITERVNEKHGTQCPPMTAIGVVKNDENLGDREYKSGRIDPKKAALYSRADRADKRALSRFISRYGYAAPDTRSYGGVAIAQEEEEHKDTIEGDYQVVGGVTVEEEPIPTSDAPPVQGTNGGSNHTHEQRQAALGRDTSDGQADAELDGVRVTLGRTKTALETGKYPPLDKTLERYSQLYQKAQVLNVEGECMKPLGDDPHITTVMHTIRALCEAILNASESQQHTLI